MFIDPLQGAPALRQEGHLDKLAKRSRNTLTSILIFRAHASKTDMALLAEGEKPSLGRYKHDPPDGGQEIQTEVPHTSESAMLQFF